MLLLQKGAIEIVNHPLAPGFYYCLFLVPMKNGKIGAAVDIFFLNQHLIVQHFKMKTKRFMSFRYDNIARFDRYSFSQVAEICLGRPGSDVCFQGRALGISTSLLKFTRIVLAVVAHLHN